jgi:CheY-like chemotaxis protein/nitrogen-specific signal transduction histidine kinase
MEQTMKTGVEILIVEDSLTQALQLQHFLEQEGYRVTVAHDGSEAVSYLAEHTPSLIISDIVMPLMDGYELCCRVRGNECKKDIPIILLTALSDPHDVIKALECGADNFVTKPYNEAFLLSRIQNILLNQELRKQSISEMGIEIFFGGRKHFINSSRMQILDLLFSTYENAVEKNKELERVNNELLVMQRELEKRNVELEKLNNLKNQFVGMAAHDLRTPLGAICTYSEFLLDEASKALTQEQIEFLATIKGSSEYLLGMVNDLLDISKIEAGKLELDLKPTDLVAVIEHTVLLQRPLAENKKIRLEFHCDHAFPEIILDRSKIGQVLDNLVSNAIKYSHPGTTIEIRTIDDGDQAVVSVRDQGQGIPPEELGKLFKPFKKISVKSTAGEKSTGLGLAIVSKMVKGHDGRVWVESEVGRGSTFYFSLPVTAEPAETRSVSAHLEPETGKEGEPPSPLDPDSTHPGPPTTVQGRSLSILLAEDTLVNQKMVVRMLEKGGHRVSVVDNGKDALNAFDREPFDLILMDVYMPELDGLEVTAAIREREKNTTRHVPIVAMTALTMCGDRTRCLEAGMDAYVTKPIHAEELLGVIGRLVPN